MDETVSPGKGLGKTYKTLKKKKFISVRGWHNSNSIRLSLGLGGLYLLLLMGF